MKDQNVKKKASLYEKSPGPESLLRESANHPLIGLTNEQAVNLVTSAFRPGSTWKKVIRVIWTSGWTNGIQIPNQCKEE